MKTDKIVIGLKELQANSQYCISATSHLLTVQFKESLCKWEEEKRGRILFQLKNFLSKKRKLQAVRQNSPMSEDGIRAFEIVEEGNVQRGKFLLLEKEECEKQIFLKLGDSWRVQEDALEFCNSALIAL